VSGRSQESRKLTAFRQEPSSFLPNATSSLRWPATELVSRHIEAASRSDGRSPWQFSCPATATAERGVVRRSELITELVTRRSAMRPRAVNRRGVEVKARRRLVGTTSRVTTEKNYVERHEASRRAGQPGGLGTTPRLIFATGIGQGRADLGARARASLRSGRAGEGQATGTIGLRLRSRRRTASLGQGRTRIGCQGIRACAAIRSVRVWVPGKVKLLGTLCGRGRFLNRIRRESCRRLEKTARTGREDAASIYSGPPACRSTRPRSALLALTEYVPGRGDSSARLSCEGYCAVSSTAGEGCLPRQACGRAAQLVMIESTSLSCKGCAAPISNRNCSCRWERKHPRARPPIREPALAPGPRQSMGKAKPLCRPEATRRRLHSRDEVMGACAVGLSTPCRLVTPAGRC